jgi:hypothetical protein
MSAEGKQACNNGYSAAGPMVMLKNQTKTTFAPSRVIKPRMLFLYNCDIWHWVTATKLGTFKLTRSRGKLAYLFIVTSLYVYWQAPTNPHPRIFKVAARVGFGLTSMLAVSSSFHVSLWVGISYV